jgi:hypothetical protein
LGVFELLKRWLVSTKLWIERKPLQTFIQRVRTAPPRFRRVPPQPRAKPVGKRRNPRDFHGLRWVPLAVKVTLSFGVIAFFAVVVSLMLNRGFEDPNPQSKHLELTADDIDSESTALIKTLSKQSQLDQMTKLYLTAVARQTFSGDALSDALNSIKSNVVTGALAPLVKQLSDDLDAGHAAVYSIWVEPDEEAGVGSIDLQLDGVDLGTFPANRERYALTVLARSGATLHLRLKRAGGDAGATIFYADTSSSEASTRRLETGKIDNWEIVVR